MYSHTARVKSVLTNQGQSYGNLSNKWLYNFRNKRYYSLLGKASIFVGLLPCHTAYKDWAYNFEKKMAIPNLYSVYSKKNHKTKG